MMYKGALFTKSTDSSYCTWGLQTIQNNSSDFSVLNETYRVLYSNGDTNDQQSKLI